MSDQTLSISERFVAAAEKALTDNRVSLNTPRGQQEKTRLIQIFERALFSEVRLGNQPDVVADAIIKINLRHYGWTK